MSITEIPAHMRFERRPEVYGDENGDYAYVDATATTATQAAARAHLIENGSEAGVDPEWDTLVADRIAPAKLHVILGDLDELPDAVEVRGLVETSKATAMWVFDISDAMHHG